MISRVSINKCLSTVQKLNKNQIYRASTRLYTTDVKIEKTANNAETGEEVKDIVERISKLSLLQVSELTSLLQAKLGVPDIDFSQMGSGAPAGGAPAAAAAAPAAAAKTEFSVKLIKVPDGAKYKIIKELREVKPSLSLMETKGLVEKTPSVIADKVSKEEADKIVAKLKASGAELEVA